MKLDNTRVITRLLAIVALSTAFTLAVGLMGVWRTAQLDGLIDRMYDTNLVPVGDVANANMQAIYHNRALHAYVIEPSQPKMDAIGAEMEKNVRQMDTLINKYKQTELTPHELALLQQAR